MFKRSCPMAIIAICLISGLTGCDSQTKVSLETLEIQRGLANDNSRFNAQKWRAENGFGDKGLIVRGDSTQQAACPQGDGWASVDVIDPETKRPLVELQCSTVSAAVGCVTKQDFTARAVLSAQKDKCNMDLPTNFKRIQG